MGDTTQPQANVLHNRIPVQRAIPKAGLVRPEGAMAENSYKTLTAAELLKLPESDFKRALAYAMAVAQVKAFLKKLPIAQAKVFAGRGEKRAKNFMNSMSEIAHEKPQVSATADVNIISNKERNDLLVLIDSYIKTYDDTIEKNKSKAEELLQRLEELGTAYDDVQQNERAKLIPIIEQDENLRDILAAQGLLNDEDDPAIHTAIVDAIAPLERSFDIVPSALSQDITHELVSFPTGDNVEHEPSLETEEGDFHRYVSQAVTRVESCLHDRFESMKGPKPQHTVDPLKQILRAIFGNRDTQGCLRNMHQNEAQFLQNTEGLRGGIVDCLREVAAAQQRRNELLSCRNSLAEVTRRDDFDALNSRVKVICTPEARSLVKNLPWLPPLTVAPY